MYNVIQYLPSNQYIVLFNIRCELNKIQRLFLYAITISFDLFKPMLAVFIYLSISASKY